MENSRNLMGEMLPIVEAFFREIVHDEVEKTLEADRRKEKPQKMYTRNEVCQMCQISKVTLWQKEKQGLIKPQRIGRRVLYSETEVKRFLEG